MTEHNFDYRQKMVDDLLEQFRGRKTSAFSWNHTPSSFRRSMTS